MFAVVYVPDFALQAVLRHDPELRSRPVALIDSHPDKYTHKKFGAGSAPGTEDVCSAISQGPAKSTLLQLTQAAHNAGVNIGMSPPQALARCGEIIFKSRSP